MDSALRFNRDQVSDMELPPLDWYVITRDALIGVALIARVLAWRFGWRWRNGYHPPMDRRTGKERRRRRRRIPEPPAGPPMSGDEPGNPNSI